MPDVESRATYVPADRIDEMQREAAVKREDIPESEAVSGRRVFLLESAAAATSAAGAAFATVGCRPKQTASGRRRHPEVQSAFEMYLQSLDVPITFQSVRDYRHGDIAELLRTLIGFEGQMTQGASAKGQFVSRDSADRPMIAFVKLEQQTWKTLQDKISDPALRPALAAPYSHEAFNRFLFYDVPRYVAAYGLYTFQPQLESSDDYGDIEFVGVTPVFFEITAIEQLDLGPEFPVVMERLGVHVTQRVVIDQRLGGDLQPYAFKPSWAGKNYHQAVAYVRSDIEASSATMLEMIEMLLKRYGIRFGEHKGFRYSTDFPRELASVDRGEARAQEMSLKNALLYWLTQSDEAVERAMVFGASPLQIVMARLKRVTDRHEVAHMLENLDPNRTEAKATAYRMDGSVEEHMVGSFNALVHREINGEIGELRYGDPAEGLRALIESTLTRSQHVVWQVSNEDEHNVAWNWIHGTMVDFLEREWGARFGMEFVHASRVSRRDQALIQLYRIAMPENERALHDLMDAVKGEHVRQYSRRFVPKVYQKARGFYQDWHEWLPEVFTGGVAVFALVRLVLRFWPGRNSGGPGAAALPGPQVRLDGNAGGQNAKRGGRSSKPNRGATRRGFLQGIFGAGALASAAAQELQSGLPSPMDEAVRRDVVALFQEHDNFRKEIDSMFDNPLLGQDSGLERQEVHDAMKTFVTFVQNAKIVAIRNPVVVASVDHEAGVFNYNPDKWEDVKRFGISVLIHEAIHLNLRQQSWFMRMRAAGKIIGEKIPFMKPEEKPRILSDRTVRNAIWTIIATKWQAETQATYAQAAFLNADAAGQGLSMRDYLLREAAPFAVSMNKTPEELMSWANLQGPKAGPSISVISDQWYFATYYDPRSVTLPFSFFIFMVQVLQESPLNVLAWLYAENPEIAVLVNRQSSRNNLNSEEQLRLAVWAHDTFFRNEEPGSGTWDSLRTYMPATAAVVASLGGLAIWRWRRKGESGSGPVARAPSGPGKSGGPKAKKTRRVGPTRRGMIGLLLGGKAAYDFIYRSLASPKYHRHPLNRNEASSA